MAFLPAWILIAAQAAPPPVIALTPPAPPPVVRSAVGYRQVAYPVRVNIRVMDGKDVLISDRLWVGQAGANITQSRRESVGSGCPESRGSLDRNVNFQINPYYGENSSKYRTSVRWSRPALASCEAGTRSVSIEQTVQLDSGQTVVLEGDAGLRVELTRE